MVVPLTLQYFYKMTSILEMLMHSKKKKKKTACEQQKHLYYSYSFWSYDIVKNEC